MFLANISIQGTYEFLAMNSCRTKAVFVYCDIEEIKLNEIYKYIGKEKKITINILVFEEIHYMEIKK